MKKIIIPNTSLCAIVRDEIMNPAGGIVDFVDSTMPFMEAGVIVDTGSKDGTREALEELSKRYPNLEVYDHQFDGFANSRNYSVGKVKTDKAFILDADERLTREDFANLEIFVDELDMDRYHFKFLEVYPAFASIKGGLNPRLFKISDKVCFKDYNGTYEYFNSNQKSHSEVHTDIEIKHFVPSSEIKEKKRDDFYRMIEGHVKSKDFNGIKAPSEIPSSKEWKAYNLKAEKINDRNALYA